MSFGELVRVKKRHPEFDYIFLNKADALLALHLPALSLPRMNDVARAAFRAILDYELPPANGSLVDFLALAEARGFCAHPSDWVPGIDGGPSHPPLYQPWVDWLSESGLTKFHERNSLTQENWARWSPGARVRGFKRLLGEDPQRALHLLMGFGSKQPAATRPTLLKQIDLDSFRGDPQQLQAVLRHFLTDRLAEVRVVAENKLTELESWKDAEAHAAELARRIKVSDDGVTYETPPQGYSTPFSRNYYSTTFDLLAKALGLAPHDLARRSDLKALGAGFRSLAILTADVETRSIVAERILETNEEFPVSLFQGLDRTLRERGLRATLKSHYWFSVHEFLGLETGTLESAEIGEWSCHQCWEPSVMAELTKGELPVNKQYDPLRVLGLVVSRAAATEILNKAVALGMKPDHPRLTMLKFNMAL